MSTTDAYEPVDIVLIPAAQTVLIADAQPEIVLVGSAGGPKGDPGPPASQIALAASVSIGAGRAIYQLPDGTWAYDDSTNIALVAVVPLISLNAANAGASVTGTESGIVTEPSWSWVPGQPIYLGPNGTLTQTPPSVENGDAYLLCVAQAVSPTALFWYVRDSIILTA